jgi:hypothetical protein
MRKDKEKFISAIRQRWAETTRTADHKATGKLRSPPNVRQTGRALRPSPSLRSQRLRDVDTGSARRGQH